MTGHPELETAARAALRAVKRYAKQHGAGIGASLRIIARGRRLIAALDSGDGLPAAAQAVVSDVYGASNGRRIGIALQAALGSYAPEERWP